MIHTIFVFGTFPPPVNGATIATEEVAKLFSSHDLIVHKLNRSAGKPERNLRYHIDRITITARCAWKLICARSEQSSLYIAMDAGWGIFYGMLLGAIARVKGMPIIAHHHSFSYITDTDLRMSAFLQVLPDDLTHIFLCTCMGDQYAARYERALKKIVVPSCLYAQVQKKKVRRLNKDLVLGHLSNLTTDKGLDLCIDTLAEAERRGLSVRLILGGPCAGPREQKLIDEAIARFGDRIDWRGPLYGADKTQFFQDTDIFLFPTKYKVEADPIVIAEALSSGIPVIALKRGCIDEVVDQTCGLVINDPQDFTTEALKIIRHLLENPDDFSALSQAALSKHRTLRATALNAIQTWVDTQTEPIASGQQVPSDTPSI